MVYGCVQGTRAIQILDPRTSLAKSMGWIALSVGKIITPISTLLHLLLFYLSPKNSHYCAHPPEKGMPCPAKKPLSSLAKNSAKRASSRLVPSLPAGT